MAHGDHAIEGRSQRRVRELGARRLARGLSGAELGALSGHPLAPRALLDQVERLIGLPEPALRQVERVLRLV